ncbi:MAG: hypothetical protein AVDCRST_MAG18-454, partial [uncultured Thermomicrobiales bacterium]
GTARPTAPRDDHRDPPERRRAGPVARRGARPGRTRPPRPLQPPHAHPRDHAGCGGPGDHPLRPDL